MPHILNCPACGKPVRVSDELMGKKVKCASCLATFDTAASPVAPWEIIPAELEPCPACGKRISMDAESCPACGALFEIEEEDRPWEHPAGMRLDCEPHRGTLIMLLGLFSLILLPGCCCYSIPNLIGIGLGITAWILGTSDLRKIRAKEMDWRGEGTTQAGKICGIVGTFLNIAVIVVWVVFIAFGLMLPMMAGPRGPMGPPAPQAVPAPGPQQGPGPAPPK